MAPPATPSTPTAPTDLPIHAFPTAAAFEAFLEQSHASAPGIYLRFAKKASGVASITPDQAVEAALCFGWIDGQRVRCADDRWYMNRYTPRRPRSLWSRRNVDTVGRLAAAGRMRAAGVAAVDAAKADGRWDRAYPGQASREVPAAFAEALQREPRAMDVFEGLGASERYAVLWRLYTASPKNEKAVTARMLQMLAEGKVPGRPGVLLTDEPSGTPRKAGKGVGTEPRKTLASRTSAKKRTVVKSESLASTGTAVKKASMASKKVVAQKAGVALRRSTRQRGTDPESAVNR